MPDERTINISKIYNKLDEIAKFVKKYQTLSEALACTTIEGKNLRNVVKEQGERLTKQENALKEVEKCMMGSSIRMIYENKEIMETMMDIVKRAEKFIILFTNQINPEKNQFNRQGCENLESLFTSLKEKLANSGINCVIIRYNSNPAHSNHSTTKQQIESILGGSRRNLDVEHLDVHQRLLLTENNCLIFSNNLTPSSLGEVCNEIAILVDDSRSLNEIKTNLTTRYNLVIPR